MPRLDTAVLEGFYRELEKVAGPAPFLGALKPRLSNIASLGGAAGAAGGIIGAGVGGVRGYQNAQEQGESGVLGGLKGALGGGVMGAGVGGALGMAGGALSKRDLTGLTKAPIVGSGARFGQRNMHGIVGHLTTDELKAVGGGSHAAEAALARAKAQVQGAVEGVDAADATLGHARAAEAMGLHSIPGIAKAVRERGPVEVARTGLRESWHSGGLPTKALIAGVPAVTLGATLAGGDDDGHKGQRIGRELGGTAGALLGSPLPIAGQAVLGGAFSAAGGAVGSLADRMKKKRLGEPSVHPSEVTGQHVPTEHVMTPGARGEVPEVLT